MPPIPRTSICPARRAFSLVEVVLVLAIVGVLSGIAAPRYFASVGRARLNTAANRVAADIGIARSLARAASAPRSVAFQAGTSAYSVPGYQDPDRPALVYTVSLAHPPYDAAIKSADLGGSPTLTFSGYGIPAKGGTVVLTNSWGSRTLTVDPTTGEVTIQ